MASRRRSGADRARRSSRTCASAPHACSAHGRPCYNVESLVIPFIVNALRRRPRAARGARVSCEHHLVERIDRPRRARQRPSAPHRDDAAGALGQHRRVADARLAPRDRRARAASPTSSSTCSSRAPTTRSAEDIAQAIDSIGGQLDAFTAKEYASYYIKVLDEHLPLAVDMLSDIVLQPGVRARRHRAREEGHPRRDQDGRGHARRSGPRALHAALLGRPSARPADSRHARKRSSRSRGDRCATTSASAYVAPQPDHLGGRQPRARAGARAGRARRSARCRRTGEPLGEAARRASCRRSSSATRSSSRATSASARAAIRRTTTTATSATS